MITWLLYPIVESVIQWWWIEKVRRRPDYDYLKMVRGAVFFAWAIWMVDRIEVYVDYQGWDSFFVCMTLVLWAPSTFFLIFNPILNKLRGRKLDYRGKDSGHFDALPLKKYSRWMKISGLLALISLIGSLKWFPLL